MKSSPRFILACVLLMLSFSISGNATDFSTCISSCESTCQFSESSSDNTNHRPSVGGHHVDYDNTQSLSISDVELGFKPVSETNSNDSLKDIINKFFLLRENSLVLDQSKSYYSDKDPHYSIICSDYYVFALRRILI